MTKEGTVELGKKMINDRYKGDIISQSVSCKVESDAKKS